MRPGDDAVMSGSMVQQVARQALLTFRARGRCLPEQQSKLAALLAEVRAADLRLVEPRHADPQQHLLLHQQHHHLLHQHGGGAPPPVTYMHICETDAFSMGVFLLKRGASIPLHDHPGMHGMLKIMYGKARVTCFDRLDGSAAPAAGPPPPPPSAPPLLEPPLHRAVLRSGGELTEHSGPCVLAPHRDNLHRIDAVDGPTAFLDILAPPYDPDDGRDCHYYRVVPVPGTGPDAGEQNGSEVWLMEISQPPDFWCGSEPYPGPGVCL
ncbi:unnamed protein product [Merluccius merluccius]